MWHAMAQGVGFVQANLALSLPRATNQVRCFQILRKTELNFTATAKIVERAFRTNSSRCSISSRCCTGWI